MAMTIKDVLSSHIDSVGYDPETLELRVQFSSGKTAVYSGVSPKDANAVMNGPSVGQALHRNIRGRYEHEYE